MPSGNDPDLRVSDIGLALGLLTRLPMPVSPRTERSARAAWAWPLAGVALGALAATAMALAGAFGLPAGMVAALGLTVLVMGSGAMHEDGLADSADGLWGGWEPARRLEIMRDSRIGTYGVVALCLSLLVRWSLIGALAGAGWGALIAAATLSRAPMVAMMALLPPARDDGLARAVGRPEARTAWIAAGGALLIAFLLSGPIALGAAMAAFGAAAGVGLLARARIGGQTGDILGAGQQMAEIAALSVLVAGLS